MNLKQHFKKIIPEPVIVARRRFNSKLKSFKRKYLLKPITIERLVSDLEKADIRRGDILMVHSSLSRIGNVVDGPKTVINSMIQMLTESGTLLMPCYLAAQEVVDNYQKGEILDLRTAKSRSGIITETFRSWQGVRQSSNSFSPVCARGAKSEYMTGGHQEEPFVCHKHSPVGRLVELEGKVMGIGVSIAQGLGVAHFIEDTWDGFPFEVHTETFPFTYIDANGETVERRVCRFDPQVSRTRIDQAEGEWICRKFTEHFTRIGIMRHFKYGNAESWIMEAAPLYQELKRLAAKNITMYLTEAEWKARNQGSSENW